MPYDDLKRAVIVPVIDGAGHWVLGLPLDHVGD
jgi:hypothetical protein